MDLTYNKLQSILPNDELHYVEDSTQFFADNELPMPTDYKFIIFSETVDYWTNTINTLKSNNIDFKILKDEWNLDYILI
tara:strand:- start:60 stop:296 length:237 start_codon:yes stop_codon:yes gene_type:complete